MSSVVKAVGNAVSSVTRSVSKVVSGAVDTIKKAASKTVDAVKDVAGSKFGKLIITAAAIYFGGAALSGGLGTIGTETSFLSGMGTGVSNAATSLSSAWTSAMKGEFSQAGSQLASGIQGQAAQPTTQGLVNGSTSLADTGAKMTTQGSTGGISTGAGSGTGLNAPTSTLNASNAGGMTNAQAGNLSTKISTLGSGAGTGAGADAGIAQGLIGAAKVTGGMQLAGSVIQGYGAQKTAEEQRAYELAQQKAALDRVNQNVGTLWWNAPQQQQPTGLINSAAQQPTYAKYMG